jgi:hypothetical protein
LAQSNLAEAMLGVVLYDAVPNLNWRVDRVDFRADGGVVVQNR